ncbi:MAG TPA: hypothetical protein VN706_03385 [Gemmatimonadaceae bacterium]|nr:hypothetical protein [Gemmatimonadaceae bacterium]
MSKRDHFLDHVADFKRRFNGTPTGKLLERMSTGVLQKEAAIAIRQLLEERRDRAETATIYVSLHDEAVDVWRPVTCPAIFGPADS